jgi:adenylyltransferase/sulfurtransferase
MAKVTLPKTLSARVSVAQQHKIPGHTVGEVITELCARMSDLAPHLLGANGKVKGHVLLAVRGEQAKISTPIGDEEELTILFATAGGSQG